MYYADSAVYAALSVCHPKFKLTWLPEDKWQWAKDSFVQAVISFASTKLTLDTPADSSSAGEDESDNEDTDIDEVATQCRNQLSSAVSSVNKK